MYGSSRLPAAMDTAAKYCEVSERYEQEAARAESTNRATYCWK